MEMLDAKSNILASYRAIKPGILAATDTEVYKMFESQNKILNMKKQMGAFSTREQNQEIRALRKQHVDSFKNIDSFLVWAKR